MGPQLSEYYDLRMNSLVELESQESGFTLKESRGRNKERNESGLRNRKKHKELMDQESKKDPLHWYGILVPQSLRDSQKYYKLALEEIIITASLSKQLNQMLIEYHALESLDTSLS